MPKEPIVDQIMVLFQHFRTPALIIAFGGFVIGAILASFI